MLKSSNGKAFAHDIHHITQRSVVTRRNSADITAAASIRRDEREIKPLVNIGRPIGKWTKNEIVIYREHLSISALVPAHPNFCECASNCIVKWPAGFLCGANERMWSKCITPLTVPKVIVVNLLPICSHRTAINATN